MGKFSAELFRIEPKAATGTTAIHKKPVGTVKSRRKGAEWFQLMRAPALLLGGKTSGAVWAVYICLLDLEFRTSKKGQPIILTNEALKEWGVSPDQKSRALLKLETLGLISVVERQARKNPHILLLKL
jgi:hypothetical protein